MENCKEKIEKLEKETQRLKGIFALFPDAVFTHDRWGRERISSPSVNDKATDCDINHSCGCCDDAGLDAYPFLKTEFGNIYSMPERFSIGVANPYSRCDDEDSDWKSRMEQHRIATPVIEKIEKYFLDERNSKVEALEEELRIAREYGK